MTPSGSNARSVPVARSRTVLVTTTRPRSAAPSSRAAMWTPMPPMPVSRRSISPVWMPARISTPRSCAASISSNAQRSARVGESNTAMTPSPANSTFWPCQRSTTAEDGALVLVEQLLPGPVAHGGRPAGRIDDVGEEDGRQRPVDVLGRLERADLLARPLVFLDERARRHRRCRARR